MTFRGNLCFIEGMGSSIATPQHRPGCPMIRPSQAERKCGRSSQFVLRRFGRPCVCGPWNESSTSGNSEVLMTREPWPISGPQESLPRRAGYRSMRLVTDIGGRWAGGTHAGRAGIGTEGGLSKPRQTEAIVAVSPAPVGVSLGTAKENV